MFTFFEFLEIHQYIIILDTSNSAIIKSFGNKIFFWVQWVENMVIQINK